MSDGLAKTREKWEWDENFHSANLRIPRPEISIIISS